MSKLQEILRSALYELPKLPKYKRVALKHIMTCKTEECGTIYRRCDHCENSTYQYKSCGSRYCNQCGYLRKSIWVDERLHETINTEYFFTTFTIPSRLHALFLYNERLCYKLLFKASSDAMKAAMKGQYGLGLEVGFMSVLHTNNQELGYHPHIHMLIPGGGISEDHIEWVPSRKKYLVKESILKYLFRIKLSQELKQIYAKGLLKIPPDYKDFKNSDTFYFFVYGKEEQWNLEIKPCGNNAEYVIQYLGRYVNKTAISDERIIKVDEDRVTIRVKDRTTEDYKLVELKKSEFIRRFFLHILPKGLGRIRYFGFLSCRFKTVMLSLLETLLKPQGQHLSKKALTESLKLILLKFIIKSGPPCDVCRIGHLKFSNCNTGVIGEVKAVLFGPRLGIP